MLGLCFYIIGKAAEDYLSPSLAKIARALKMSESLAGVTFLAFGNGAGDVTSSVVASGMSEEGIFLAASGLIGSCTLMQLFLAPIVIILSKVSIKMPVRTFGRDNVFMLLTLTLLLTYFLIGFVTWYMALFFPLLYVIYVLFCFIQDRYLKKAEVDDRAQQNKLFEEDLAYAQTKAEAMGEEIVRREGNESFVKYTSIDTSSFIESHIKTEDEEGSRKATSRVIKVESGMARSIRNRLWRNAVSVALTMYFLISSNFSIRAETHEEDDKEEDKKKSCFSRWFGKIVKYGLEIPTTVIMNVSIPPCNEETWNRNRAMLFPVCSLLMLFTFMMGICILDDFLSFPKKSGTCAHCSAMSGGGSVYIGFYLLHISFEKSATRNIILYLHVLYTVHYLDLGNGQSAGGPLRNLCHCC